MWEPSAPGCIPRPADPGRRAAGVGAAEPRAWRREGSTVAAPVGQWRAPSVWARSESQVAPGPGGAWPARPPRLPVRARRAPDASDGRAGREGRWRRSGLHLSCYRNSVDMSRLSCTSRNSKRWTRTFYAYTRYFRCCASRLYPLRTSGRRRSLPRCTSPYLVTRRNSCLSSEVHSASSLWTSH